MKIIKRNGAEVPFDITKIITAVTKASDSVGGKARLSREQITDIAAAVTDQCQALNRAISVEEIQDMVENQLMDIKAHDIARHYITYRYIQSLKRQTNTTDERILSLIECQNEEVKQENANKNPTVNSVQRDYMAGEISKDLTARLLLDPEIVKAHQEGLIHFHDSDYFAQHMHNCDLVNLDDMLQNGTVISRHLYREAPQLLHRLQHRHPDHRTGGLQPVRRPEHQPDPSGPLRGRLPQEDRRRGRGRDGGSGCLRRAQARDRGAPPAQTRSTAASRPSSIRSSP